MNSPYNNKEPFSFKRIYNNIISCLIFLGGSVGVFGQEVNPDGYNIFYYENGRIASEGLFENGLPIGVWKSYYADGTLKSIGKKSKGLSDSLWVFFDSEGRKTKTYEYMADKKNGCAVFYDTLGDITKEMFYINDVAQGERVEYYPDGTIRKQTEIVNGKEVGQAIEYGVNGDIITEEIYDNGFLKERNEYNRYGPNGEKTGVWRTYYPNGSLATEVSYKNGEKSGLAKTFNKKGKLIDLQKMEGDTVAGHVSELVIIELYKEFYPNGKAKLVGGIDNGMRTGIFREYDEEGKIINGYIYEKDTMIAEGLITGDGTYQGPWTLYYKSGKIKAKGEYVDSKREGKWIFYYSNGKKEQEGQFKENKLKGEWIWYYRNGQVQRQEFYNKNERLEGTVYEYDSLGNEMTKGDYYNGEREGDWFYHVGDFKEVGAYTVGMQNGVWNYYYKNGKVAFTGNFVEGEAKGKHIYYHQNGIPKLVGKYLGGEKNGKWISYNDMGEKIQEIEYKRGEIYKIDGFKVTPIREED